MTGTCNHILRISIMSARSSIYYINHYKADLWEIVLIEGTVGKRYSQILKKVRFSLNLLHVTTVKLTFENFYPATAWLAIISQIPLKIRKKSACHSSCYMKQLQSWILRISIQRRRDWQLSPSDALQSSSADTFRRSRAATYVWNDSGRFCSTLQHIATHCNALQRTATHCNTRRW